MRIMHYELRIKSVRIFFISAILVFLMVVVQRLGLVQLPRIISPEAKQTDLLENIRPKLEQRVNRFQLKSAISLVPQAVAGEDYDLAKAYLVVDLDSGEVLLSSNPDKRLPEASLTKIMTAVVAMDLASLDEKFMVSDKAAHQIPTKLNLTPGEKISLGDLLHGLMLVSANDTAQVIQEGIDAKYGSPVFIAAMNEKAKILGLKNSHFMNPQGFDDPDHYSTVSDLAVLSEYALTHYPKFAEIVALDHSELAKTSEHVQYEWLNNWNGLIGVYPGAYGVKIGNTGDAGYTTVVASQRGGHRLLTVMLGANGVLQRDIWASELLDRGFEKYGLAKVEVSVADLKAKYSTWKYYDEKTDTWR